MPIVVNGTTIPENVANVLNVNGTNITSVACNGVTVWTQSLFNALWSGNSIATYTNIGLQTSSSSYRFTYFYNNSMSGTWQTVSSLGIFSGNSVYSVDGFIVSGNLIRTTSSSTNSGWVTFTLNTKSFSGSSSSMAGSIEHYFNTSGGLLRWYYRDNDVGLQYGSYISLT